MPKKNPNPDYSATVQHLLDLISSGKADMTIGDALKFYQDNDTERNQLDKMWDIHQYPDKRMKYVKSANYNECRARYELSANANMVLTLFEHVVHQSGLVQISLDEVKDKCNISLSSARRGIAELLENGFMATHTPKTGKQSPIYMLNPVIAKAGKPIGHADSDRFEKLIVWNGKPEEHPLARFSLLQGRNDNVAIITQKYNNPVDGTVIKFNSLHTIANKEKESPVGTTDNSDIDEIFK